MSLGDLAGRTFAPTEPYEVTPERVAAFAASTGATYDGGPPPATFPIVVAFAAIRALVDDPSTGLSLSRIVHGEQRFTYHRPVRAGDVLTATLTVETVRGMGEAAYLRTVTDIRDAQGDAVVSAWATLVHHGPAAPTAPSQSTSATLPAPRSGGQP